MHDEENSLFYTKHGIIELARIENQYLDLLLKNKGRLVLYKEFMKVVYKRKENNQLRRRIASNINRLKKKLGDEVEIKQRRNLGYMIL